MITSLQDRIGTRFRRIITSAPDGVPPWLHEVARGDDAGMFGPADAPWRVHANLSTLIGGIRALLVQALHPGSLAGVAQHSRYEQDALGRLAGTTRWLTIMTFASREAIADEAARVNAMHARVTGTYGPSRTPYRAADPALLLWVHVAFTDSFLSTFQLYSGQTVDEDEYVSQWAAAVVPLGLHDAPRSAGQLREVMARYRPALDVSDTTRRVVRFIRKPPLSRTARAAYWFLFHAAVASLPREYRQMLGLRAAPMWLVGPVARTVLRVMRAALGPRSPLEEAALSRLARLDRRLAP